MFFNCKNEPIDEETGILVTEIAHWVLERNRILLRPGQIEVMDLSSGRSHTAPRWRESTLNALSQRAKAIASLWEQI